jgi:hypothetical protein
MRQDQGIVVDVDDPRLRGDGLGDLMGIVRRRQAGPDIQELPDPGPPARYRTTRPRNKRSSRACLTMSGSISSMRSPSSRSTA